MACLCDSLQGCTLCMVDHKDPDADKAAQLWQYRHLIRSILLTHHYLSRSLPNLMALLD